MMDEFSLTGKTALVAGSSRGIGLAIAQSLSRAGADTILAARSIDALRKATDALRAEGSSARECMLDISSSKSVRTAVSSLPDIDILINAAGINLRKRFQDYTREEYDRLLQTNLHGIVELTQQVGGKMIARGKGGKVVMIGSLMSILGLPFLSVYAITKSGLAGLTRALAAEWGRYNIQVNCIAPGFILTDLNRDMWQTDELHRWRTGAQANPQMGTPADIAPLAVLLSGRGSDYITGQVIAVDGGYSTTASWPFEP